MSIDKNEINKRLNKANNAYSFFKTFKEKYYSQYINGPDNKKVKIDKDIWGSFYSDVEEIKGQLMTLKKDDLLLRRKIPVLTSLDGDQDPPYKKLEDIIKGLNFISHTLINNKSFTHGDFKQYDRIIEKCMREIYIYKNTFKKRYS